MTGASKITPAKQQRLALRILGREGARHGTVAVETRQLRDTAQIALRFRWAGVRARHQQAAAGASDVTADTVCQGCDGRNK